VTITRMTDQLAQVRFKSDRLKQLIVSSPTWLARDPQPIELSWMTSARAEMEQYGWHFAERRAGRGSQAHG
jgi:hypothetical protein